MVLKAAAKVAGGLAGGQAAGHRVLHRSGHVAVAQVAQHHGRAEDGRRGVGLALARDVRGGAVHRLEKGRAVAQVGAGAHAQAADEPGGKVAEDVAEQVGGDDHLEVLGPKHHAHGHRVHQGLFVGDPGELLGRPTAGLQEHGVGLFEHVDLVHRGDLVVARLGGELKGAAGDAVGGRVGDDPGGGGLARLGLVLAAEVQALAVFAHDHHVGFRAQAVHALISLAGAQVGPGLELGPQAQNDLGRAGSSRAEKHGF